MDEIRDEKFLALRSRLERYDTGLKRLEIMCQNLLRDMRNSHEAVCQRVQGLFDALMLASSHKMKASILKIQNTVAIMSKAVDRQMSQLSKGVWIPIQRMLRAVEDAWERVKVRDSLRDEYGHYHGKVKKLTLDATSGRNRKPNLKRLERNVNKVRLCKTKYEEANNKLCEELESMFLDSQGDVELLALGVLDTEQQFFDAMGRFLQTLNSDFTGTPGVFNQNPLLSVCTRRTTSSSVSVEDLFKQQDGKLMSVMSRAPSTLALLGSNSSPIVGMPPVPETPQLTPAQTRRTTQVAGADFGLGLPEPATSSATAPSTSNAAAPREPPSLQQAAGRPRRPAPRPPRATGAQGVNASSAPFEGEIAGGGTAAGGGALPSQARVRVRRVVHILSRDVGSRSRRGTGSVSMNKKNSLRRRSSTQAATSYASSAGPTTPPALPSVVSSSSTFAGSYRGNLPDILVDPLDADDVQARYTPPSSPRAMPQSRSRSGTSNRHVSVAVSSGRAMSASRPPTRAPPSIQDGEPRAQPPVRPGAPPQPPSRSDRKKLPPDVPPPPPRTSRGALRR